MKLRDYELKYKSGLPFQAELSRVSNIIPHRHDSELELVYCLEGEVHLEASDQKATLTAGQLHSIDYDDIHCLWSDDDNITLIFHLNLRQLPQWESLRYILFACESLHLFPYQEKAMERVKDIVLSLTYAYFTDDTSPEEKFEKPLNELVDLLLHYFTWYNYENQDDTRRACGKSASHYGHAQCGDFLCLRLQRSQVFLCRL